MSGLFARRLGLARMAGGKRFVMGRGQGGPPCAVDSVRLGALTRIRAWRDLDGLGPLLPGLGPALDGLAHVALRRLE